MRVLAFALALVALAGCSEIPLGTDPALAPQVRALRSSGLEPAGKLAIAPLTTFTLAGDEAAKGWQRAAAPPLDAEQVLRSVEVALRSTGAWTSTRLAGPDALADAWTHGEDYTLELSLRDVRTSFDGHNGWWIPNILNFFLNTPIAAWWVATETYSLSFTASCRVASASSGATIWSDELPVRVEGTFDDFDRGWQFFGPLTSSLDAEGWQGIASRLFPAARTQLSVELALRAAGAVRSARASVTARGVEQKTLGVVVGITHYEDPRAFPPLAHATDDAVAFAEELGRLGALPHQTKILVDRDATVAAVTSAVEEQLERTRDGDRVIVYFAGYGTRGADGSAALLLHDATANGDSGVLALDELARRLARASGEKLIVIDAGFGGGGRSIVSRAPLRDEASALESLGVTALLAAAPGEPALAPEHLRHGLLTYRLLELLESPRDLASGGGLDVRELAAHVQAAVLADAELLGTRQTPRVVGAGKFSFERNARR